MKEAGTLHIYLEIFTSCAFSVGISTYSYRWYSTVRDSAFHDHEPRYNSVVPTSFWPGCILAAAEASRSPFWERRWGYPSSWMLDFRENPIVRKGWLKRGTPTKRKPQFLMWGKGCHEPPSHHLSIIAGVCIPSDGSLIVLPRCVPIQNIWIHVF